MKDKDYIINLTAMIIVALSTMLYADWLIG